MKRALLIVSLLTLVVVGAATASQALVVTQGIYYDPNGQPIHPTMLTQVTTILGLAGILAMPLTGATFILGIVATGLRGRYGWLLLIVIAGALAFVGLVVMAWILLSERSPLAFQTPFALVPLVTLLYSILPSPRRTVTSVAV